jgi:hypothetical protein
MPCSTCAANVNLRSLYCGLTLNVRINPKLSKEFILLCACGLSTVLLNISLYGWTRVRLTYANISKSTICNRDHSHAAIVGGREVPKTALMVDIPDMTTHSGISS